MPMEPDEIRATLRDLINEWHATAVPVDMRLREHSLIGLTVYGLTAHAYVLAEAALTLHGAGQIRPMTPLVRQELECAITAVWVELAGYPAALALLQEQARASKNTVAEFVKAGVNVSPELTAQLADDLERAFDTKTTAAKRLEQRCREVEGAGKLYATYRQMSATSHAGASLVDLYVHPVEPSESNLLGVGLSTRPKTDETNPALGMALMMVIVATSAWSRLDAAHRHRTRMKELHHKMGTAFEARLSGEGFRLQQQRERELRAWANTLRSSPDTVWQP